MSIPIENPPPQEHDSDFTIVYDKEDGFKKVPLDEIQGKFNGIISLTTKALH